MADPQAAALTQLRNIQARTGKTIGELHAAVASSGLTRHGERRTWLMTEFALGYGDANAVVTVMGPTHGALLALLEGAVPGPAAASAGDPLDALYTGGKAHLRALHDAVMAAIDTLGAYEMSPKKTYVSLRRKKQFAMVGPATKDLIEIGLNAKDLAPHVRLKAMPPGGMCSYTVRLGRAEEVDADLLGWLRTAWQAAG